ncbi:MAG: hypothetical protein ACSLFR_09800, partial [Solirubrobacteraceae bacterium]
MGSTTLRRAGTRSASVRGSAGRTRVHPPLVTRTTDQIKRGLASAWTTQNPVLLAGQLGVETDTRRMKVGDGTAAWNALSYFNALPEAVATKAEA